MIGTKLFAALQKLSEEDWDRFEDYLGSPLLGNSPLLLRFLQSLRARWKAGETHTAASLHREIYPFATFPQYYVVDPMGGTPRLVEGRAGHMKRHFSGLLEKLYDFWGFQQYQKDTQAQSAFRMAGLARCAELSAFEKDLQKANTHLSAASAVIPSASRLLDVAVHAIMLTELQAGRMLNNSENRFQIAIDRLDEGYLLAAIDLACKAYNHDQRYEKEGQTPHLPPRFLELARVDATIGGTPFAGLLIALYQMYQDKENKHSHFQRAKSALFGLIQGTAGQPNLMLEDIMNHLVNFAGREIRANLSEYHQHLQDLYDFALRHGVYLQRGQLSPQHYQNIVRVFLKIKSFDWVANFLVNYKHQLPAESRELVFGFNRGLLQFRQGHFGDARNSFLWVEKELNATENLEFSLQLRALLTAIEYEQGNFERAHGRAQSFLAWLKVARGLPQKRTSAYLQFARLVKKMARLRMDWVLESAVRKWEAMTSSLEPKHILNMVLGEWLVEKLDLGIEE